jgi:hypothetical protein
MRATSKLGSNDYGRSNADTAILELRAVIQISGARVSPAVVEAGNK